MKEDQQPFSKGDDVRVIAGPLRGLEGVVSSCKVGKPEKIVMAIDLLQKGASAEVYSNDLELVKSAQDIIKEELDIAIRPVSTKLIYDLAQNPNKLHQLSGRKFEELVAELLSDMGYDVIITPMTRDGGRDILAYFTLPHGNILTIVDCKRFSQHRKIGPDIIQRLLWISNHKDHASHAMVATTSYFTSGAKDIAKNYEYQLSLKDFNCISEWLSRYGTWQKEGSSKMWLPAHIINDK